MYIVKWLFFQFLVSSCWDHTLLQSPNNICCCNWSTEDILQLHCLAKDCVFCEKKDGLKNKIKLEVCPYLYLVAHIMAGHVACWFEIIFLGNKQATANNWCCDLKLGKSCASNITEASDVRSSTILLDEQTWIVGSVGCLKIQHKCSVEDNW